MSMQDRKLRNTRRLIAGVTLALVVSFATAAMVVLLPQPSVSSGKASLKFTLPAVSEYVELHRGRNTAAPSLIDADVATSAR